jgi:hypothetical protein
MHVPGSPKLNVVPPRPPEFHIVRLAFDKQSSHPVAPVTTIRFVPTQKPQRENVIDRMHAQHEFDRAVRRFWWAAL